MIKPITQNNYQTIQKAVRRLSPKDRLRLLESLEAELFPLRLKQFALLLKSKAKITSLKKITALTKKARKEIYAAEFTNRS